jgi:hypothetical protein
MSKKRNKAEIDTGDIPLRDIGGGPGWAETRKSIREELFPAENPKVKKLPKRDEFADIGGGGPT